jgi:FixJ family two-component response regulator
MPDECPLNPETVFLVDDDSSILRALERLLRAAGFNVAPFISPQEFLDQQNADATGCIVLDVAMPGLSGLELGEALARAGNRLPIIFLTGHDDIPTRVRAMQAGAVDFLCKPCPEDELLAAIKRALVRDRRRRSK